MSKAEDRYLDLFLDGRLRNCSRKDAFLLGYHQAEKDLELTVEDIIKLDALLIEMWHKPYNEYGYQEVLKRFKDFKERKEK